MHALNAPSVILNILLGEKSLVFRCPMPSDALLAVSEGSSARSVSVSSFATVCSSARVSPAVWYLSIFLEGQPGKSSPPQNLSKMQRTDVWRSLLQSGTQGGRSVKFFGLWQAQITSRDPVAKI